MREMIRAFEAAGHTVMPVIKGGLDDPAVRADRSRKASGRLSSLQARVKPFLPDVLWETLKDLQLLRLDRTCQAELEALVQKERPDLIYERATYLQASGVRVAFRHGIPHVLEMNSPYVDERKIRLEAPTLLEGRANRIEFEQLSRSSLVAVVSEALRSYFVRKHRILPEHVIVTPNAINPSRISINEEEVASLRAKFGLQGCFVAGFVGSVLKWHRVDLLIKACAQLRDEIPSLRVLVVGDSRLVPEIRTLAQQQGVEEAIVFAGQVEHDAVFNHIALMDVAVLPDNLWYQSPVKVFEYGAMGKPVIAPDNETLRNLLKDGEEGLLIEPSIDDLTGALRKLSGAPFLRMTMGQGLKERVLSDYTWDRNVERILLTLTKMNRPHQRTALRKTSG